MKSLFLLLLSCAAALAQATEDSAVRIELGRALLYDKNFSEAAEAFRQVAAAKPGDLDATVGLAQALFWGGNPAEALAVAKTIPPDQRTPEVNLMLGDLCLISKDLPGTEKALVAYLDEKPEDAGARVKLADVQSWTKQYDKSLANFEQVLIQLPGDRQVRRKYGTVLSWAGRYQDAARELKLSLEEKP